MANPQKHQLTRRQFLRITAVAGVSLAVGGGLLELLSEAVDVREIRETRIQMGTLITISILHPDARTARQMVVAAFDEIERLESILSRHRPDTAISRLNEDGFVHDAPAEAIQVIQRALEYSVLTSGSFDITMKPVLDLFALSFARNGAPPADSEVREALSLVDYQNVVVDDASVGFKKPGMSITLDGIAKGFIADRTLDVLRGLGAEQVLVDAGGDFGLAGSGVDGQGWRVAVQDPRQTGGHLGILRLRDRSVATSGDYLQYFSEDRRFHHIIDPRTGNSPNHTSAVTVIAPTALAADALSTAALVQGPVAGLQLLEKLEDVEGVIVSKDQEVFRTRGMGRFIG